MSCEGKPISKLPDVVLPYVGSEIFALVQDGDTRSGTLDSFISYLSGVVGTSASLRDLSGNWQDTYNIVIPNGGAVRWDSNFNTTKALSSRWESAYTTVYTLSDIWQDDLNIIDELNALSGKWEDSATIVQNNSSSWYNPFDATLLIANSGSWNSTYTTVNELSDVWESGAGLLDFFSALTANWENTYTTVDNNSANWDSTYTTVCANSCAWNDAYLAIACTDETSEIFPGVVNTFRIPYEVDLTEVRASVSTAPNGNDIIIDVKANNQSIFNNLLYIDDGEKSSVSSSSPHSLNVNANLTDDEEISITVTQVGSTSSGAGLKLTFIGNRKGCL